MKDDEIKNILNKLNNCKWEKDTAEITYKILFGGEVYKLLDYITNLQQENERLKKLEYKFIDDSGENESFTLEEYLDIGNKLYDSEREKEDYKSRCERAVEYIKINFVEDIITVKTLLNILNGRSDE